MKGLIAPLLALMMTGMVFSQQPQSSRFGSGNDGANGSGELQGKYLLVMDDEWIQGLIEHGQLKAEISPEDRRTVDHVVFHGNNLNAQRQDLQPFNITQTASIDGNGKLEFMLSDSLIRMMRRQGLQYIIRSEDRGRYNEVVVSYESDRNNVQPAVSNVQNNRRRFGQQPNNGMRNQTTANGRNSDVSFRGTGNRDVQNPPQIGPQLPDDWDFRRREMAQSQERESSGFVNPNRPTSNPLGQSNTNRRLTELDRNRTMETETYQSDLQRRRRFLDQQQELARNQNSAQSNLPSNNQNDLNRQNWQQNGVDGNRANRVNRDLVDRNWGIQTPTDNQEQNLVDRRNPADSDRYIDTRPRVDERFLAERQINDDRQKLSAENDQLRQMILDERRASRIEKDKILRDRQLAEMDAIERQRELEFERKRKLDRRRFDDEYRSPYDEERFASDYPRRYADRRVDDRVVVDDTIANQQYVKMPARSNTATPSPTNRPPAFAIEGPNTANNAMTDSQYRTNQALWFIMLCSVGLNFYLFWIARGFYVRYEELADEIRDSFTGSTMG